jgi:hypothetical protein
VRDAGLGEIITFFDEELRSVENDVIKEISDAITKLIQPKLKLPGVQQFLDDLLKNVKAAIQKAIEDIVRKVIDQIRDAFSHTVEDEEWLLRVGVNGVWQSQFFGDVLDKPEKFSLPPYRFFLGPEDSVSLCANGIEFDPVGDLMLKPRDQRNFHSKLGGSDTADWAKLIANPDFDLRSADQAKREIRRDLITQYFQRILTDFPPKDPKDVVPAPAFGFENSPLGMLEPADTAGTAPLDNPLAMQGLGLPFDQQITKEVHFASVPFQNPQKGSKDRDTTVGDPFVLVEEKDKLDYNLSYKLQIELQDLNKPFGT